MSGHDNRHPDETPTVLNEDLTVLRADSSLRQSSWSGRPGVETAEPDTEMPRVLKQRFALQEKLGSGGMGTVFRARDLRRVEAQDAQPFVAVKVLNNDFRRHPQAFIALEREATKSQKLSHPNIVSIFDFDKDGDWPFITMELLEGRELSELVRAYPNGLPFDAAKKVISGLCSGLQHAHSVGVVHADFKPGNVFVADNFHAKILDFGIARAVRHGAAGAEDDDFDPGQLAALTPAYASLEMVLGDNPEARDDVYSLALVVYLLLTGHHPYGRLSAKEALEAGLRPERPKGLSRRQWKTLESALQFHRQHRPASVQIFRDGLLGSPVSRASVLTAAAAAVVLALGVAVFIEGAEIDEVKEEARQSALLDAQVARVNQLLADPAFDETWRRNLAAELATLSALDAEGDRVTALKREVWQRYLDTIEADPDSHHALTLLREAERYGAAEPLYAALEKQIAADLVALDAKPSDTQWVSEVVEIHALVTQLPEEQAQQLGNAVRGMLARRVRLGVMDEDELFLEAVRAMADESLLLDTDRQQMELAISSLSEHREAREAAQAVAQQKANVVKGLRTMLPRDCVWLDVQRVATGYRQLVKNNPDVAGFAQQQLSGHLESCIARIGELDPDRARSVQRESVAAFGNLPGLNGFRLDPCSQRYLIGNGARAGRGGTCADELRSGVTGPRLVVVPGTEKGSRFAITRQEIGWQDVDAFCRESGACQVPLDAQMLPVTAIPLSTVQDFAEWLTRKTGYTYRLPEYDEWLQAVSGEADPNRNCRLKVNGIERGLGLLPVNQGHPSQYGLLNTLGNAREWVTREDGVFAAGGAFKDAWNQCSPALVEAHSGEADAYTGFRLVREVS